MKAILDLDRYPIDRLDSDAGHALLDKSRISLEQEGMFTLSGFIRPAARNSILEEVEPVLRRELLSTLVLTMFILRMKSPG